MSLVRVMRHWLPALVLCVALPWRNALADDDARIRVGRITKISDGDLTLDAGESLFSIGFDCVPAACGALRGLRAGDVIIAAFGVTESRNVLQSIRICSPPDPECDAVLKRQERDSERRAAEYAASVERKKREAQALEQMFALNAERLTSLPTCGQWRRLVAQPSLPTPPHHFRGGTIAFAFELGDDGTPQHIALEQRDVESSEATRAVFDWVAGSRFEPAPARCRQTLRFTFRFQD